ncbi:AcrR family transcriptional regulator [Sinobaca qinghaiensis]|uniref:AcrR family transcriptional regulator n=1 Tax=Sinobaca qinghaiensis TaxID=342944 RepID=A0A419UWS0_9BACL|nr:TetR/AcrR family transcriptional regulator [Sinobaca qinghaiensis]RKD69564.1 AcrR family transcriptional regulator [Sinobaca qinghaiensis]
MPRIVDHDSRKKEIVNYAWQSIVNEGSKGASIRKIANLANMAPGQIRYYFPIHSELLKAVMDRVIYKVRKRIEVILMDENLLVTDRVLSSILAVIPLDAERYADMVVWMAFNYELHLQNDSVVEDDIELLIKKCIQLFRKENVLNENVDEKLLIARTYAIVDGIAMHILFKKGNIDNEIVEALIREEIYSWMK